LAREITKALSGAVGDFIATATVKKNCELIGTTPDSLTADQLTTLSVKIEKSVAFFTDDRTASDLAVKVRAMS
jgi:hypothetical protein